MLLRLKVKNFLSFGEEMTFDMFPNLKRTTLQNHIYHKNMKVPLLKQAAIYGANGSGKSNLLQAMEFLQLFANKQNSLSPEIVNNYKFRLKDGDKKEPIHISTEFMHKGIYYLYSIDVNSVEVENEMLSISGIEEDDEIIFSRDKDILTSSFLIKEGVKEFIESRLKSKPLNSFLSFTEEYEYLLNDNIKNAFEWFDEYLRVLSIKRIIPTLISRMSDDNLLLDFTNSLFKNLDIGVSSIEIEEKRLIDVIADENENNSLKRALEKRLDAEPNKGFSGMKEDRVLFSVEDRNGEKIVLRFLFNQIGVNGYEGKLECETQSVGTVKLLNLIPALYEIKHHECTYFIDEIENSVHPKLIFDLLEYIMNSDTQGQLIYTTHETELLNQQKLMRSDEVWFTEKEEGQTKLYSLNDFKEHNTINIKNGYLDGRYGAIPFIGNLNE